ncbi:MAG: hypothetical protein Q9173_005635 [Seirophora scorigena]
MAIIRVCKQLYHECFNLVYRRKTYIIDVYDFGIDFLRTAGGMRELPPLAYRDIKELVIRLAGGCYSLAETGSRVRENLAWVCGLLSKHPVRPRKLRIAFPDSSDWLWADAWDQEDVAYEDVQPPAFDDQASNDCNANILACERGCYSTFGYMLSVLPLLPVIDECIVECYEEWIKGRDFFDEDDWHLQQDRAAFEHYFESHAGYDDYGFMGFKLCRCVARGEDVEGKDELWRRHRGFFRRADPDWPYTTGSWTSARHGRM